MRASLTVKIRKLVQMMLTKFVSGKSENKHRLNPISSSKNEVWWRRWVLYEVYAVAV